MPAFETVAVTLMITLGSIVFAFLITRALFPIPIRFEASHDEHPETLPPRLDQRLREAGE